MAEPTENPRSLRILFLAPQPFFEVRGTPLAVRALVEALSGFGHTVHLLTYPQGEPLELPGVRQIRSLRLPVGRVRPGFSLAKLLLDGPFALEAWGRMAFGRYDVVHAVEEAAHLAAPLARALRLPLVMDVDSSIADQLEASRLPFKSAALALVRRLEARALRGAAAVITVCGALSEGVRRIAPEAPVFQIEDPPLVDATTVVRREDVAALRRSLGLGDGPVALYSGNFEPYQGVDLLVDAAPLLGDVQLVLMGGEPAEIESLRKRAARLGVAHRVFFSGKRPPTELPAFLDLADVLVSPRRVGRNTPFKVYTYLASGKPLVATAIATHTQILTADIATLVGVSAEDLAAGIRSVLGDPLGAIERAIRGRALVEREYGRKAFAGKVQRAYEHVARAVKPRPGA
jgi:glycosyltransferase involved in cell wall biosynthesis